MSETLRQDTQAYTEAHDMPLDEAIRRLPTQDPMGEPQTVLQEKEVDVFGGLWIEHEPHLKVVVLVMREARHIERRYPGRDLWRTSSRCAKPRGCGKP